MKSERLELLPGVRLNMIKTDRFKTGCFSFNLLRPLTRADAAPNALLPSVLLRGCRSCPDMQSISQRLDILYGASVGTLIRKKGDVQTVGLYADFLEDRYAEGEPVFSQMMEFLRELIFEPFGAPVSFVQEYVDGEVLNLSNTIDSMMNDKRVWTINRMLSHMGQDEAYAVPRLGTKESLAGISGINLYARWQELLATSPIELFYMGQQSKEAVVSAIKNLLTDLPRKEILPVPPVEAIHSERPAQHMTETMDVTQGKLAMGFRTDITARDPRYPALMLLNAVYGGGMTSKLFLEIREAQSLCYYANSTIDKFKGIMIVEAGIEFADYDVAVEGILHQLELCKKGEISQEELESARTFLLSGVKTGKDSPGRLDDYAIGQAVAGLTDTMEDLGPQLEAVTMEQVVEAANTLHLDTVYFLKGVEA